MLTATAPCAVSPVDAAVEQTLAAAEAAGVELRIDGARGSERPAPFMRASSTCRCKHRPQAAGLPTATGYALLAARPDLAPHVFLPGLAPPAPTLPASPLRAIDPIPV